MSSLTPSDSTNGTLFQMQDMAYQHNLISVESMKTSNKVQHDKTATDLNTAVNGSTKSLGTDLKRAAQ